MREIEKPLTKRKSGVIETRIKHKDREEDGQ